MKEKVKWLVNELIKSDAGGLPWTANVRMELPRT